MGKTILYFECERREVLGQVEVLRKEKEKEKGCA